MAETSPFTAEEVQRLRRLLEIEAIRETKIKYAQLMDGRRVDDLANLFTEDALCEFGPYGQWRSRETIRTNYQEVFSGDSALLFGSLHNTPNHWVELTGPTTATGRSYLIDVITNKPPEENPIVWFGIYDEDYEKVDGQWLISRCSLQFLWPERNLTDGFGGEFPNP
ncbi:MAG: nuclear transport factor 2 family protein [Pseudomonadales bacterium]